MKEHEFSKEYVEKKAAFLRSVGIVERAAERRAVKLPLKTLVIAAAVCIMLTVSVMAAVELVTFRIIPEDDKTIVQLGEVTASYDETTPMEQGVTVFSAFKEKGEIPRLIFIRDYMPSIISDAKTGNDVKFGDFDAGVAVSIDFVYLGGEGFTYELGAQSKIEEFEINGHSAMIITRGETMYYNKILSVYFEDRDILVNCFAGYGVPHDELKNMAAGFRFEEAVDGVEAYPIVHNHGRVTLAESVPDNSGGYRPLLLSESISLGDTVTYEDLMFSLTDEADTFRGKIDITPVEVRVVDSLNGLDTEYIVEDNFEGYVGEDGYFISYPRTELIKGTTPADPDSFGVTENVKKKLVLLTFKMKNTSEMDGASYVPGNILLHVGDDESRLMDFVYDKTPQKYSSKETAAYYDGGGKGRSYYRTELAAGEEKLCTIGYLVDDDMISEAYVLFRFDGDIMYNLSPAK